MKTPLAEMPPVVTAAASVEERHLPSGRSVTLRTGPGREEIEVRSPDGDVEVRISLTAAGPVVRLTAARLELEATGEVNVECARFAVAARDGAELKSGGDLQLEAASEIRVQAGQDARVDGKMIYLNCPE